MEVLGNTTIAPKVHALGFLQVMMEGVKIAGVVVAERDDFLASLVPNDAALESCTTIKRRTMTQGKNYVQTALQAVCTRMRTVPTDMRVRPHRGPAAASAAKPAATQRGAVPQRKRPRPDFAVRLAQR